ncbi:MAG: chemotaxis protein CheW [Ignavibacteria bacterium]
MPVNLSTWVIFRVYDRSFSLSAENIIAIIKRPDVTNLPQMFLYVKGIIKYREEIFTIYDLN